MCFETKGGSVPPTPLTDDLIGPEIEAMEQDLDRFQHGVWVALALFIAVAVLTVVACEVAR
jgi:hypothetical protein